MKLNGTGATTTAKNEVFIGKDMKTVVLWRGGGGYRNLVKAFFLVEEDHPRLVLMMEF